MRLTTHSDVPVYTISGSSTARPLPEWLARKRKRSLKADPEYASRVELLQDFEFEEASQCIRLSDDGQWVVSTGTYKPQIHVHSLPQLSLSFARHTTSLNSTFELLSSDYSKSVHLQNDRSIEFHTAQGCHYSTRVPRYGRDLKFHRRLAEVLVPSVGTNESGLGEVFRLNLELGRFMKSYEVEIIDKDSRTEGARATGSVNAAAVAEQSHGLLAFGTSLGAVEFFDPRTRRLVNTLHAPWANDMMEGGQSVTAIEFHESGLRFASGSSGGLVHLYDLRSPIPYLKKDQGYGFPIQDLIFLSPSTQSQGRSGDSKILSADKRVIKIWDNHTGRPWTSVEPAVDVHCVAWCKDSGILLTANEGRQQHAFFIPQLGPAPKWCSFLDNLVEEMAEDPNDPSAYTGERAGETYDNYKFLTMQQLGDLNLAHLVGTTTLLRPYMHGYFVAQRLYDEAKLIADPFVWEEQRAKRVREKIEKEREGRIRGSRKFSTKVNQKLADRLQKKQDERDSRRRVVESKRRDEGVPEEEETPESPKGLLADPRFSKLFEDKNFAIDETSHEYRMLHPGAEPSVPEPVAKGLTAVEEEMLEDSPESESDASGGESYSEGSDAKPVAKPATKGSSSFDGSRRRIAGRQMRVVSSGRYKPGDQGRSFASRMKKGTPSGNPSKSTEGKRRPNLAPSSRNEMGERKMGPNARKRRSAGRNAFRGI